MTVREATKSARLEARISRSQKDLFERAAALEGRSLTDFVVSSLRDAATRVIREHEMTQLSRRDSEAFVKSILAKATPSRRLKAAARRYKRLVGS